MTTVIRTRSHVGALGWLALVCVAFLIVVWAWTYRPPKPPTTPRPPAGPTNVRPATPHR